MSPSKHKDKGATTIQLRAQLQALTERLESETRARRQAEQALADTEQSLAMALASTDAGFIATDRAGVVTRMNAVSERLTGWPVGEAIGLALWRVFDVDGRRRERLRAHNPVDLLLERADALDDEQEPLLVARDGTRTPVVMKVALTHAADGSVRGLALVLRDRSRAMQAEIESSRLAAIVDSSQDAIIGKTLDGVITSWNAAAEVLFGYRAEEAIGQSVLMLIPEDHWAEEMRIIAELARGARVKPFDTVRRTRDGRLIELSLTVSPIRDAGGRIVGASKIARDISERKRAEGARRRAAELEAENRRIQESSRLKSQFLANMSHELRTPLNAIIGFADLLLGGYVPAGSPKHDRFVGHIGASGRHLLQLINDVLDLSKVEAGKLEFYPERIDLARLAHEIGDVLQTAIDRQHVTLRIQVDARLGELMLDAARLKQVLYNYLSNAIKFTPAGGAVTVRALPEGEQHFRLEVEDTGIGIAPQQLGKLFNEFQQLGGGYSKQHAGTGLGLALTRRLVRAQGGEVGARSTPGRGSVFHVVLNRVHGAAPLFAADANEQVELGRVEHQLLVVAADGEVRSRIVNGLSGTEFQVAAAATAEQATRLARDQAFDALTLDLNLPDESGLGLLARLRDEPARGALPVIGLSTSTGLGKAASFAITNILCKPIRADEVVAAMSPFVPKPGRTSRVMVIDDDPTALDLMSAALSTLGIEADCLLDSRLALEALERRRPDAVVLDLMMPELDGFALQDLLQASDATRELPVFIWTSMLLSDEDYERLARSALAILDKGGGDLRQMLERLRRWRPANESAEQGA